MAISLLKELKQNQKLSLTPQLRKSIDLLQLSRFELIQKINREIDINPFLESDRSDDYEYDNSSSDGFDFNFAATETLYQKLFNQINDEDLNKSEIVIASAIINCIDESGCLVESINEIEEILKYKYSYEEIERVLTEVIHNLNPPGIGYRNFKECILIQIKRKNIFDEIKEICEIMLYSNYSNNLDSTIESLICKGFDKKNIDEALRHIKSCDLSPGNIESNNNYILPDLNINLEKNDTNVNFVSSAFPVIKLDDELIEKTSNELRKKPNDKISSMIKEAKWLLSAINNRNNTVLKVGKILCERQIDFFIQDPSKIIPLTNKDIAKEINMHPSTVSRILRSKYINTPNGVIPLKSLTASSVSKTRKVTSHQLMEIIKSMIKNEKKAMSDDNLTRELNKKGYSLARRTITKYRIKLGLPSSRKRKKL